MEQTTTEGNKLIADSMEPRPLGKVDYLYAKHSFKGEKNCGWRVWARTVYITFHAIHEDGKLVVFKRKWEANAWIYDHSEGEWWVTRNNHLIQKTNINDAKQ